MPPIAEEHTVAASFQEEAEPLHTLKLFVQQFPFYLSVHEEIAILGLWKRKVFVILAQ
jgi:hypothetical protein